MAAKRVLFFGVTGVDKASALNRMAAWAQRNRARAKPQVVDFEGQYLFNPDRGGAEWYNFLDDQQYIQRETWHRAWTQFIQDHQEAPDGDLFVAAHACIVRGHYGVRSVVEPQKLAEWWPDPDDKGENVRPDLIVTLLDDVYDMWWRTEARAGGEAWKGRPTIEQLLFARRVELIVADQVAHSVSPPIPHFMISVGHPCETLGHRIYSEAPAVVYLCFPISAPRDMETRQGDSSGVSEIMNFLSEGYKRQKANPDLVLVNPLGIDELPLLGAMKDSSTRRETAEKGAKEVVQVPFDREARRWAMGELWPADECLSGGPPAPADRKHIPLVQLRTAAGIIHTDVGWRDYRLVEQAKEGCLAAFNPKFKNRDQVSRSVREEIRFAAGICPVYVYQAPGHDPGGVFEKEYPQGGTMTPGPGAQMVVSKPSVAAVFDAVEELARKKLRRRSR